MVNLALPPPTRKITPRSVVLPAGKQLVRPYNPRFLEPNGFNHFGPRSRFDHHREAEAPAVDMGRGIYYAAASLRDCVVEVFGDTGVIEAAGRHVAVVEIQRPVLLLDLTGDGAWLAGSVAALTKHVDRLFTQAWARYFYECVSAYGTLDGVRFENAHNAAPAYALFERVGPMRVVLDLPLTDSKLTAELAAIALELGLYIS